MKLFFVLWLLLAPVWANAQAVYSGVPQVGAVTQTGGAVMGPTQAPYVLDRLSAYPAAAYSVRQMTAGPYLPAYDMTVRRSSDNATANIGFSGGLENVAQLATFCAGTNAYLVTWKNQGSLGSAGDASQSTAANQPQVCAAGVVQTQGGVPTLVFNGGQQLIVPAAVSFGLASSWFYSQVAYYTSGCTAGVGVTNVSGVYYNESASLGGAVFSSSGNYRGFYVTKSSLYSPYYGLRSISYNLSNQTAYVNFNGPANQNSSTITSANWVPLAGFSIGYGNLTGNSQEFLAAPSYRWTTQDNKAYDLNAAAFYNIAGVTQ